MQAFLKYFLAFSFFVFSFFSGFSQDELIVTKIEIVGNDITKQKVILRELMFSEGESVNQGLVQEYVKKSEENLLNTSLFNFVDISYIVEGGNLSVTVDLQERWYIWPYPVFEHADRNLSSYLNNQEWDRIDYGLFVMIHNFRGRKEILKMKAIFGFNNSYSLTYYNPYINRNQTLGLGFQIDHIRNKEVAFDIKNDELTYLKIDDQFLQKKLDLNLFGTYRPNIYLQHFASLKYSDVQINDSIKSLNRDYFYNDDRKIDYFTFVYNLDLDKRDSKVYPLKGLRLATTISKTGLGIFQDKGPLNLKALIEENLQVSKKIFFNVGVMAKFSLNNLNSFYFTPALGYDNYLRGMEYYVSNGRNYYISKTNLKYEIIPQTVLNINFLRSKKFSKAHYALYTNLFFDTGYVDNGVSDASKLSDEFLYSGGVGIDFVTYYDKVLRIEYSINKFGEHGIFFHLGAPIIEKL